jgi:hypothetical protein
MFTGFFVFRTVHSFTQKRLVQALVQGKTCTKPCTCFWQVGHNHPSGNLTPSSEDKRITQKIKDGCYLLDLSLIDHVILSPDGNYLSFADEGILYKGKESNLLFFFVALYNE